MGWKVIKQEEKYHFVTTAAVYAKKKIYIYSGLTKIVSAEIEKCKQI